jgi:hypothetical protein
VSAVLVSSADLKSLSSSRNLNQTSKIDSMKLFDQDLDQEEGMRKMIMQERSQWTREQDALLIEVVPCLLCLLELLTSSSFVSLD